MALIETSTVINRGMGSLREPLGGLLAVFKGRSGRSVEEQLAKRIAGHPIFRAPHASELAVSGSPELQANFDYFFAQRRDRVGHARFFLATFDVDPMDQVGVEAWLDLHGPLLTAAHGGAHNLLSPSAAWPGASGGLNVVLDLAVALGEAAIARDPRWSWQPDARAWGTYAALTVGAQRVDLVSEMALCCRQPGGLAALRARLGVDALFDLGGSR